MAKQSASNRLTRLNDGRCPEHGIGMTQVGPPEKDKTGRDYCLVGCPRGDCLIIAKMYFSESKRSKWELSSGFTSLLDDKAGDPDYLDLNHIPKKATPSLKKFRGTVWDKSNGFCYYCGCELNIEDFTIDHIIPLNDQGATVISNLAPCCKSCNSKKGTRSLEEFRFAMRMDAFEDLNGIRFTKQQLDFLKLKGAGFDLPKYSFWFESANKKDELGLIDLKKVEIIHKKIHSNLLNALQYLAIYEAMLERENVAKVSDRLKYILQRIIDAIYDEILISLTRIFDKTDAKNPNSSNTSSLRVLLGLIKRPGAKQELENKLRPVFDGQFHIDPPDCPSMLKMKREELKSDIQALNEKLRAVTAHYQATLNDERITSILQFRHAVLAHSSVEDKRKNIAAPRRLAKYGDIEGIIDSHLTFFENLYFIVSGTSIFYSDFKTMYSDDASVFCEHFFSDKVLGE